MEVHEAAVCGRRQHISGTRSRSHRKQTTRETRFERPLDNRCEVIRADFLLPISRALKTAFSGVPSPACVRTDRLLLLLLQLRGGVAGGTAHGMHCQTTRTTTATMTTRVDEYNGAENRYRTID
jgi:hypothetical protein